MPSLGGITKIFALLNLGRGIVDKAVFQRLLAGTAALVGLSVIAAILIGTIIIGLLALIYYGLTVYTNVSNGVALALVALIIVTITTLIIAKIIEISKKIATFSSVLAQTSAPASPLAPVTDIVNAFIDGFRAEGENHARQAPNKAPKKFPRRVK